MLQRPARARRSSPCPCRRQRGPPRPAAFRCRRTNVAHRVSLPLPPSSGKPADQAKGLARAGLLEDAEGRGAKRLRQARREVLARPRLRSGAPLRPAGRRSDRPVSCGSARHRRHADSPSARAGPDAPRRRPTPAACLARSAGAVGARHASSSATQASANRRKADAAAATAAMDARRGNRRATRPRACRHVEVGMPRGKHCRCARARSSSEAPGPEAHGGLQRRVEAVARRRGHMRPRRRHVRISRAGAAASRPSQSQPALHSGCARSGAQ